MIIIVRETNVKLRFTIRRTKMFLFKQVIHCGGVGFSG